MSILVQSAAELAIIGLGLIEVVRFVEWSKDRVMDRLRRRDDQHDDDAGLDQERDDVEHDPGRDHQDPDHDHRDSDGHQDRARLVDLGTDAKIGLLEILRDAGVGPFTKKTDGEES